LDSVESIHSIPDVKKLIQGGPLHSLMQKDTRVDLSLKPTFSYSNAMR
jgi:hypothetical protein